jgi:hypothetical protein
MNIQQALEVLKIDIKLLDSGAFATDSPNQQQRLIQNILYVIVRLTEVVEELAVDTKRSQAIIPVDESYRR